MKKPYLPIFPEYVDILKMLNPDEVLPVIEEMFNYCISDKEIDFTKFSPLGRMALLGVKPGLDKSKQLREYGHKGGLAGKGVSRNKGNKNALKNNSQTIAKQKPNNSQTIAKQKEVEEEVEVEEERSIYINRSSREASAEKLGFDKFCEEVKRVALLSFDWQIEEPDVFDIYNVITVSGFVRPDIKDWKRYVKKVLQERIKDNIASREDAFGESDACEDNFA